MADAAIMGQVGGGEDGATHISPTKINNGKNMSHMPTNHDFTSQHNNEKAGRLRKSLDVIKTKFSESTNKIQDPIDKLCCSTIRS